MTEDRLAEIEAMFTVYEEHCEGPAPDMVTYENFKWLITELKAARERVTELEDGVAQCDKRRIRVCKEWHNSPAAIRCPGCSYD